MFGIFFGHGVHLLLELTIHAVDLNNVW